MAMITVYTPTYNRKKLLKRLYESLIEQSCKDFVWLVIDDGSTDDTRDYIANLQNSNQDFKIEYFYKENGGLHTAYNEAFLHLKTELCLCCDSDDWLPADCIDRIKHIWEEKGNLNCAGIVGLDYDPDGNVIGSMLPDTEYIDLNELYIQGKLIGDKKLVVRSELYRSLPQIKSIKNEKNFNPNYYNVQLSEKYKWICVNENLCFVEYQPQGMTNSIFNQYVNSPNSFIELRKLYLSLRKATLGFKIKHIIHYDAECILAGRPKDIFSKTSPKRPLSILFAPVGVVLYLYIKGKVR